MEVHLTPAQEAFIRQRIDVGRFASADEAVQEAVALLEQREANAPVEDGLGRKSLAQLFRESPFRGLDIEFCRDSEPMRDIDL